MDGSSRRGRRRVDVRQVRLEGQPAAILGRASAEHWSAAVLWRRLSPYVSVAAIRMGLSANTVTWIMVVVGWLAAASLLLGTVWGALLAVVFAHAQMILDASDGEVARWRRTTSAHGVFLDRLAHTTTEGLMPACLGFGLALQHQENPWPWVAGGLAIAALVLANKSVNDGVSITRASLGLERLPDVPAAREPRPGALRTARRLARFVPVHRMYHSVEQSHLYLAAFLVALAWPPALGWLVVGLVVVTPLVIAAHVAATLSSPRLDP